MQWVLIATYTNKKEIKTPIPFFKKKTREKLLITISEY